MEEFIDCGSGWQLGALAAPDDAQTITARKARSHFQKHDRIWQLIRKFAGSAR